MKSFVFLSILVLCTACMSQSLPVVGPSPTLVATQPSLAATKPVSPLFPARTPTPAQLLPSPTPILEIYFDKVAISQQGSLYASGFGVGDNVQQVVQWEGTKWTALSNDFQQSGVELAVDSAGRLFTDVLTAPRQGTTSAIMRWDGARWEDITGNFTVAVDALQAGRISSNIPVMALAVDGEDHLYAAGSFAYPNADHTEELSMGYVAKWDQETWTVLGQGFDQVHIFAMAVSATGKLYVSGEQPRSTPGKYSIMGFVAEWNGETWTQIGTSKLGSCLNISILALDNAADLYAGCTRDGPGGFIFYWDGTDWITITNRLEGEAPAIFDMAVDADGHLYIGGSFESVSGTLARNIAYWDGSTWHALREGTNGRNGSVNALAFDPSGELYAVGSFTEAGGLPAQHVARWDGETWHALGP